jgi:periplasmic protein TonB
MPHALLLSPDDQAVSSITGVLEEMSVTCERPLDGASAAQKLNSQSFDLVLVDCENLPAAKLIFDVCRRGKNGNNPVPIAIVDGRAGLPTAFRLGAELILTKPVAKDQARSTIRAAVSRVRKDVPASESVPAPAASAAFSSPVTSSVVAPSAVTPGAIMPDGRAHAAAAAASSHAVAPQAASPQMTSFAEPAPSFVPSAAPTTLSTPAVKAVMHSAVEEIAAPVAPAPVAPKVSAPAVSVSSKSTRPLVPSDDPVLRELEDSELASELEASDRQASEPKASDLPKPAPPRRAAEPGAPVFSSYQQKQKPRGSLVALLVLVLAAAGFYAAWIYEPGFREIAEPQIDRLLTLAGIAQRRTQPSPLSVPVANPVKPLAPATTSAPGSPTDSNQAASAAPDSAASSAAATALAAPAATPTTTAGTAVAPPTSQAANTTALAVIKAEAGKASDSKKEAAAAASSDAELPGESSAIILSSKGAEKRLVRSTPPKYPAAARASGADGTVVLKAVVNEDGKIEGLRLVEGDAALAAAAMQAVKQWRYRPYVRNGQAQPFQTVVIVDFQRP